MEMIKDHLNRALILDLANKIGRAGHTLKSQCQGLANLAHPELLTIDNLAGGIEGEIRGLKSNLVNNWDIRYFITVIAKSSNFMTRITSSDFIKDASVKPALLTSIQELTQIIFKAVQAMECELMGALVRHSQSVFDAKLMELPAVKLPDFKTLEQFDKTAAVAAIDPAKAGGQTDYKQWLETVGEHLGNKAHQTQETVDMYVHNVGLKAVANKIINLSGAVENEARNSLINTRKAEKIDANAIKKNMENARAKLVEERKVVEEQKIWEDGLKERLVRLFEEQEKVIEKIEAIVAKA